MSSESKQIGSYLIRPVHAAEVRSALRIILGDVDDSQLREFENFAYERRMDLSRMVVAEQNRRVVWAKLPIVSPGKTMMLMGPNVAPSADKRDAAVGVICYIVERYTQQGVHLAQCLIDPHSTAYRDIYRQCGFWELAELVYLQKNIPPVAEFPEVPPDLQLHSYSPQTHELFRATIATSYQHSLDCPKLQGLRDVDDVIEGHKAAGEFDPNHWFVLSNRDRGLGVLLLTNGPHGDAMELVYLGLIPDARHYGLGSWLMKQAIAATSAARVDRLALAVDSRNEPALKLYHRFGMKEIGSRLAMLRDLRR